MQPPELLDLDWRREQEYLRRLPRIEEPRRPRRRPRPQPANLPNDDSSRMKPLPGLYDNLTFLTPLPDSDGPFLWDWQLESRRRRWEHEEEEEQPRRKQGLWSRPWSLCDWILLIIVILVILLIARLSVE